MNEINLQNHEDEIQIKELLLIIWKRKYFVSVTITAAVIISLIYALSLPNIYTSNALLSESNPSESLNSKIGEFSTIANMAGIQIPNTSGSKIDEAMARIKSYDFFTKEFLPYIQYENLVAAKSWDKSTDTVTFNKNFNSLEKIWIKNKPTQQEAFEIYNKNLNVSQDNNNGFVSLTISHVSPYISEKWLDIIIVNINNYMREIDRIQAENSIDFLNQTANKTNINQIKEAIARLIESQIQTLMLVESNKDYVFKEIVSPIAPEKKSGPSRTTIVLFGIFIGVFIAILVPILMHYWSSSKDNVRA